MHKQKEHRFLFISKYKFKKFFLYTLLYTKEGRAMRFIV